MPDSISIESYSPQWPEFFEQEKRQLQNLLNDDNITSIEHIGSTAVYGLSAKPIIDIMILVRSFEKAKLNYIPLLERLEYVYWDEDPKAEHRMFFVKGMPPYGERRTHHIHIVQHDNTEFTDRLKFRDHLKTHPKDAKAYETLKIELSKRYPEDREAYTSAKSEFIRTVMKNIERGL